MAKFVNYNEPKERKIKRNENGEELIKNQECVSCKNLFNCKGKPRGITACLNYAERKS